MDPEATTPLLAFLKANRGDERYLVAAQATMPVAPLIIASGEPAVSLGGFIGADPAIDLDGFVALVESGALRFVLSGPGPMGGGFPPMMPPIGMDPGAFPMPVGLPPMPPGGPPGMGNSEIMEWVAEHGEEVDPALWRPDDSAEPADEPPGIGPGPFPFGPGGPGRMAKLYDLRPELGYVDSPSR